MKKRNKLLYAILAILIFPGCISHQQEVTVSKALIPLGIVGSYFGSVALHEAGHAIAADARGGRNTKIYVLPKEDSEGNLHLGLTETIFENPTELDITIFRTMGPTAQYLGHLGARGLLRSNQTPIVLQPSLAWFSLFNQIGYYFHTVAGLARVESTDLGKEEIWISGVMLVGGLTIDLIDLFSDKPERYLGVLFGQEFYREKPKRRRLSLFSSPTIGGGVLGLRLDW